ncbi:glutamate receptor 1-like [Sitophilus oryzae]|uniref:Glutamate receptor 1-like n=1 Tax=Sitophilus oryzae TaxID=7048 RepID=A0A6J2XUL3_SITOR|nr:glutamate receptor 1-like [Sitophilus oryzae]
MQVMDDRWEAEVVEYGAINITGFRIVDSSRKHVRDFLEGWKRLDPSQSAGAGRDSISAQAALMYDAVSVLVEAFNKILRKKPDNFKNINSRSGRGQLYNNGSKILDCNHSSGRVNPWEHGDKISRYLRKVFIKLYRV